MSTDGMPYITSRREISKREAYNQFGGKKIGAIFLILYAQGCINAHKNLIHQKCMASFLY